MPPRYAYWTILVDNLPTAFRAAAREDLLPTFERLRSTHPDAVMRWFARGRLWDSPENAAREGRAPRQHRDKGWRPGGDHRDPRERFEQERKAKNAARRQERFELKTRNRRGDRAAGAPPDDRGAPPPRGRDDRPRDRGEGRPPDAGRGRGARDRQPGDGRGRPRQPGRDERGGADRPQGPRGPRPDQRFGSERRPPAGRPRHQDGAWRGGKGRDRGPQDRAVPPGTERPRHHREREGRARPPRDDRFAAHPRNDRGGDRAREPRDRDRGARPPRDDRFAARPRDERGSGDRAHGRGDQRGSGRNDGGSRRGEQPRHDDRIAGKRPDRGGGAPRPRAASLETRRGQAEPQPNIPPGPDRPPRPGQEPPPVPARSEEIVIPPAPPERGRSLAGPEGTRLIKRRGGEPR